MSEPTTTPEARAPVAQALAYIDAQYDAERISAHDRGVLRRYVEGLAAPAPLPDARPEPKPDALREAFRLAVSIRGEYEVGDNAEHGGPDGVPEHVNRLCELLEFDVPALLAADARPERVRLLEEYFRLSQTLPALVEAYQHAGMWSRRDGDAPFEKASRELRAARTRFVELGAALASGSLEATGDRHAHPLGREITIYLSETQPIHDMRSGQLLARAAAVLSGEVDPGSGDRQQTQDGEEPAACPVPHCEAGWIYDTSSGTRSRVPCPRCGSSDRPAGAVLPTETPAAEEVQHAD